MFYCLLVVFYIAGIGLYAHRVWITISKGGPMHEVRHMTCHMTSGKGWPMHVARHMTCHLTSGYA